MAKGLKSVRAKWLDATADIAREDERPDPPAELPRVFLIDGVQTEVMPGAWPGAPCDKLPPDCPVIPIGKDGPVSFFIDSLNQFRSIGVKDWSGNTLVDLFGLVPNTADFYWPRWSESKKGKPPSILGLDVRDATKCLLKAAAKRGTFDPSERVRGRGAWDLSGTLLWHAGNALYRVQGARLENVTPGEVGDMFYPARPRIMTPWPQAVPAEDSPAQEIFKALKTWSFERGNFDAVLIVGGLGCMMLSGALPYRPHMAFMGDFGVGKTALMNLSHAVLGSQLQRAANTSEAGIRQRLGLDALPVAIDEFEATADNARSKAIIDLARISYDGARMWRGGADHKGVEFQARSGFFCNGIQIPPMGSADRSRFATVNLGRIDAKRMGTPPVIDAEAGRMILRALMDAWPSFKPRLDDWRVVLRSAGLSDRAQNTYGTLFAVAELLLGVATIEDAGFPITEAGRLGELIAKETAEERGAQTENWRACIEYLLGSTIDAWKGGGQPTPGAILEQLELGKLELQFARERLAHAGLGVVEETKDGRRRVLLAVPQSSPALEKLFAAEKWKQGGWTGALKQGVASGVVRADPKAVKINRVATWCRLVDLVRYDEVTG